MQIHQAYYGESDGSHRKLGSTLNNDELNSYLLRNTDRPGSLPSGYKMEPYFSGERHNDYFIFSKTLPVTHSTRNGLVFSHVIILNISDAQAIDDLNGIFNLFVTEIPTDYSVFNNINSLGKIEFQTKNSEVGENVKLLSSALLSDKRTVIFIGTLNSFGEAIIELWRGLPSLLKAQLKFHVRFTPENFTGLDIVYVQPDLSNFWKNESNVIDLSQPKVVGEMSIGAKMISGLSEGKLLLAFSEQLDTEIISFDLLRQIERSYIAYQNVQESKSSDEIRGLFRLIAKLSPSFSSGASIKANVLDALIKKSTSSELDDIFALANLDCSAYVEGERKLGTIVNSFIKNEFDQLKATSIDVLVKIIYKSTDIADSKFLWWNNAVHASIKAVFENLDTKKGKALLRLTAANNSILNILLADTPNSLSNEKILIQHFGVKLRDDLLHRILEIAENKKWFLLHANIALVNYSLDDALTMQFNLEKGLPLSESIGLDFIAKNCDQYHFIKYSVKSGDDKLLSISTNLCIKQPELLSAIDVSNSGWLKIWSVCLENTKKITSGIEEKSQEVIDAVFDLIVEDKNVPEIIIDLIVNSSYVNIAKYTKRTIFWDKISMKFYQKFLDATAQEILKEFLSGIINVVSIEKPVLNKITNETFIANFFTENKNNIDVVIKIFESFPNLKDGWLASYLLKYNASITEDMANRLGTLVLKNEFKDTARVIKNKSHSNRSYKLALDHCKDLVTSRFWDFLNTQSNKLDNPYSSTFGLTNDNTLKTIVILTAIKEEFLAVKIHLKDIEDIKKSGTNYEAGIFEFNGVEVARVIIRECGAKNNIAAQEAERAINNFSPDLMLFVGIAGSRKPMDFSIGDVIFPSKVYYYEAGKATKDSFLARPNEVSPTYSLLENATTERNRTDWKILIKGNYNKEIKAEIGVIASGEQLVEHYNSQIGEILIKNYNDTAVLEMEGYGFLKAAYRQAKVPIVGVVRGISDILKQEGDENNGSNVDRRPANSKLVASDTAAAFAFWLIYKTYTEPL